MRFHRSYYRPITRFAARPTGLPPAARVAREFVSTDMYITELSHKLAETLTNRDVIWEQLYSFLTANRVRLDLENSVDEEIFSQIAGAVTDLVEEKLGVEPQVTDFYRNTPKRRGVNVKRLAAAFFEKIKPTFIRDALIDLSDQDAFWDDLGHFFKTKGISVDMEDMAHDEWVYKVGVAVKRLLSEMIRS